MLGGIGMGRKWKDKKMKREGKVVRGGKGSGRDAGKKVEEEVRHEIGSLSGTGHIKRGAKRSRKGNANIVRVIR
jgi:hypothetical protein